MTIEVFTGYRRARNEFLKKDEAMTEFKTVSELGLKVFYREAGEPGGPKLVLLGGFPSSSHQFRNLIPALADRFHLVSFDYPGFENTELPDPASWEYTFDHLADVAEAAMEGIEFTGGMGFYMQDYGSDWKPTDRQAPRVARLASNPERQRL